MDEPDGAATKRLEIGINPFAMVVGVYGAHVSYKASKLATFKVDVTAYRAVEKLTSLFPNGYSITGSVQIPFFENRAKWGNPTLYLEPAFNVQTFSRDTDNQIEVADVVAGPAVFLGSRLQLLNGLTASTGFGWARDFGIHPDNNRAELRAIAYLRFGYAF